MTRFIDAERCDGGGAAEFESSGGGARKAHEVQTCLDKMAEMSEPGLGIAERIHVW